MIDKNLNNARDNAGYYALFNLS
jgi:DNA-directed RNA polymerase II subunit RPB1